MINKIAIIAALATVTAVLGVRFMLSNEEAGPTTAAIESANDDGCPGSGSNVPRTTLKIQYTEYFEDSKAEPTTVNVVVRDNYRWRRVQSTVKSKGMPIEEKTRRMEELSELGAEIELFSGDGPIPPDKMAIYREAREQLRIDIETMKNEPNNIVNDRIYVDAPPPEWSFEYDNESRVGQRERKIDALKIVTGALGTADGQKQFMDIIKNTDLDQATKAGTRTVAGHTCEVVQMSEPFKAEICQKKFGVQEIVLYSRWSQGSVGMINEAVSVEEGDCVPLSQFALPADVDWGEDW